MRPLTNLYQVSAAIGDIDLDWFDDRHPAHLLSQVYPVPEGAVVVERIPPRTAVTLARTQRGIDTGTFRVHRVTSEGEVTLLTEKAFGSRRGAQYWAQRYAEKATTLSPPH